MTIVRGTTGQAGPPVDTIGMQLQHRARAVGVHRQDGGLPLGHRFEQADDQVADDRPSYVDVASSRLNEANGSQRARGLGGRLHDLAEVCLLELERAVGPHRQ